jgi:4-hydroxy-3-methylbut-2-enyl diphosphate reductase
MSRSTARKCVAPGTTVAPGEVLVATEVGDPARGLLPCPAAPLIGGTLARRGIRVRYGPVPRCADASQADDGAAAFVTSTLHSDGGGTAIGAAADAVDGVTVAAASAAVEEWSAVVATRRLLGAVSPWCDGARQAMERAADTVAAADGPVYIVGELAGTAQALAGIAAAGAVFAGGLAEVPDGATVLIPAHGVAPSVLAEAAGRGLTVVDATCPLVAGAQEEARRFGERGDQVVLIGQPGHAVVPGIAGQVPGKLVIAATSAGAGGVGAADPRRVSYVLQPGIPVEDAAPVMASLRSRFPALRGPDPDRFCYAASDRAETVRAVASACDVLLVLGDESHPDTRQQTGLARGGRAKVHVVGEPGQIMASWLAGTTAIGLADTVSASAGLAGEVTTALSGLGQLSVTQRRVTTEITGQDRWSWPWSAG